VIWVASLNPVTLTGVDEPVVVPFRTALATSPG
jgi:hypothetical protein